MVLHLMLPALFDEFFSSLLFSASYKSFLSRYFRYECQSSFHEFFPLTFSKLLKVLNDIK